MVLDRIIINEVSVLRPQMKFITDNIIAKFWDLEIRPELDRKSSLLRVRLLRFHCIRERQEREE